MSAVAASRPELRDDFAAEVPGALEALARRHGFRLGRGDEDTFLLESPRCRVRLRFGSGHVPDLNVTLGPPPAPGQGDQEFGLGPVLEAIADPTTAFAPRPLRSAGDVRQELERVAALLERHCERVFQGDFSAWPALRRMAADAAAEWKRSFAAGGRAGEVWQARDAARTAYGQGDYRRAASLYESIEEDLTPDERLRLEHARGQA